eukprot:TRINITY_DN2938_c0_g1_i2.p1 TRINITY_DN2938_c0_g1~~TRINITY_DN2938_c0_g1_i2.p1  ORF type:complete len:1602 (+),score=485.27 TRINITY_DN2938_c0_g1_i2:659-4807(+)
MLVGGMGPDGAGRLFCVEMPTGKKQTMSLPKKVVDLPLDCPEDFPLCVNAHNGLVYVLSRYGVFSIFDVQTVTMLHREKISEYFFVACPHSEGGVLGVTIEGKVLRAHLQSLTSKGDITGAIDLALSAPHYCLRTIDTVKQLQGFPQIPGQSSPLMVYLNKILEEDKLNKVEGIELANIVLLKQGGAALLAELFRKKKIEASEELADKVEPLDTDLALSFYAEAKCHTKAVQLQIQRQQFSKALSYITSATGSWSPDVAEILTKLIATNADGASEFALLVHKEAKGKLLIEPAQVVGLFLDRGCVKQATGYLLAILTSDREQDAELQTKLFEMNLLHSSAQVVEALFTQGKFTKFDCKKIATLCEKAGLYLRALKLNCKSHLKEGSNMQAVERCGVNAAQTAPQWLPEIVKILQPEDAMSLIRALVSGAPRLNAPICADAIIPQLKKLPKDEIIELFCEFKAYAPLFSILAKILPDANDEKTHTTYIECALKTGQTTEIEAITRTSDHYDPTTVLTLLNEVRLSDPWPYINVCDKHKMWESMVGYLMGTRNLRYLDLYVTSKQPDNTPNVIGALLDAGADDDYIISLINKVHDIPIGETISAVEKRGKITMILPWMEATIQKGSKDEVLVTTLAKQYIDNARQNAKEFLEDHKGDYNSKEVGAYAESKSPELALVAYETGANDEEVLRLAADNKMYNELAGYLLKRQDLPLWNTVLSREDKKEIVDSLITYAIPRVADPTEISVAVKAFTQAGMPGQLTAILEKLILGDENSPFSQNRYLQNLLLLTVIQTEPSKAMAYIQRMDKYDIDEMAAIALKKGLNEEALEIYKRPGGEAKAMHVLLETVKDIERAKKLAERTNSKECWGLLGKALLKDHNTIKEALISLTKAEDATQVREAVDAVAKSDEITHYEALVTFLETSRKAATDGNISFLSFADTELAYSLAKCGNLTKLSQFLADSNLANLTKAGDRCYKQGLYEAARVLFTAEHNHPKLASTLLHLKQYLEALDAAQKAGSIRTWKEVCFECVNVGELRLAQMAAQHIIVAPEELDGLCQYFEAAGKVEELQSLLKTGLANERTHIGMYTQLGLLLTRHSSEKVMDFLKMCCGKMNRVEMLRACEVQHLWGEARYLHTYNEAWDSALSVMLDHPSTSWTHEVFKESCGKATVIDHIYSGISLYMTCHPDLLSDFLFSISNRVNPERVVLAVQRHNNVGLIVEWLKTVQKINSKTVNEAINEVYIEEEDYEALRDSLSSYTNFDRQNLCTSLSTHPLMELRRVASWIHAQSGKHSSAIETALEDKLYQDAIQYALESGDSKTVSELLNTFMDNGLHECFAATLYTCYEIAEPDVAIELAWKHKNSDIVMPYVVQVLKELWDSRCSCKKK